MRTVADIMATRLITVPPDMNIHEAIRILLDKRISGAPVVDENGALVGMLSKKDCLKIVFSSQYHDDWGGPVRSLPAPHPDDPARSPVPRRAPARAPRSWWYRRARRRGVSHQGSSRCPCPRPREPRTAPA